MIYRLMETKQLKKDNKNPEILSIGEIMIESIFSVDTDPLINSTTIVKNEEKGIKLGGAAINVAWYLGCLGKSTSLIASISKQYVDILIKELKNSQVNLDYLVETKGETDKLYTLLSPQGHRSIYKLGDISEDFKNIIIGQIKKHKAVVLNGGRHNIVRETFEKIVENYSDKIIIFNPSYAIYEYSVQELYYFLKNCDICFLNEDEYNFAQKLLKREPIINMPRLVFVTTKSSKGATMFSNKHQYHFKSVLKRKGIFLGAGDACLAGFLTGILDNASLETSLQCGLFLSSIVVEQNKIRAEVSPTALSKLLY